MFELPDAKRVRREDLLDDAAESEGRLGYADPEAAARLRAKLNEQLAHALDLTASLDPEAFRPAPSTATKGHDRPPRSGNRDSRPDARPRDGRSSDSDSDGSSDAGGEGGDVGTGEQAAPEEFEFRLFRAAKPASKVVLEADKPARTGDGGLAGPGRPLAHYLAAQPTPAEKAQFEASAVTGEEVLGRSAQRWWGMEMPWKVVKATAARGTDPGPATDRGAEPSDGDAAGPGGRKRPGKKRRIASRIKLKVKLEKDAAARKKREELEGVQAEKERQLRDKKKRLNREKKIKRRAKEREKKMAAKAGGTGEAGATESDSGTSD